jgi:hypothetical protein
MNLVSRSSIFGAALLISLFSGCGPAWKVIKVSGPPSALAGATDVAVAFDYSQMVVEGKPLADFMAAKTAEDAKYPETWANLTGKFEAAVLDGIKGSYPTAHPLTAGPAAVTMVVTPHTFKMGKFIPFVMPPTMIDASLVFQVNGQATDEISMMRSYPSSVTQPSVFNHIGYVGNQFGQAGARMLSSKK